MAVHNGSNAFVVLLPSGTVTDLGPMAAPTHTEDGLSQYSWAYWGVAEFFNGATWIRGVDRTAQRVVTIEGGDALAAYRAFVACVYLTRQAEGR